MRDESNHLNLKVKTQTLDVEPDALQYNKFNAYQ